MKSRLDNLKKNPIIKALSSIKITVVCLLLLFVLTFWGTVAQVTQGLYQSQERFFHSWYFLAFDFLPIPGGQLVLWVMFVNLAAVSISRFIYRWSHIGIILIHIGLLTYFFSAFVTLHVVEESNLTLAEGEGSNVSSAYYDWEISLWKDEGASTKNIYAYDSKAFKSGDLLKFDSFNLALAVKFYFPNANAFVDSTKQSIMNVSGINELSKLDIEIEPEKNNPGGMFELRYGNDTKFDILLYGRESQPTTFELEGIKYNIQLRRKRYPLPISIVLNKFQMEKYPGTEMARSYRSFIEVDHNGVKRDVEVYMNHPFRHKQYAFYQASYSVDAAGQMRSTLAVVKNSGQYLPYISSLITFLGLSVHFLMMGFKKK